MQIWFIILFNKLMVWYFSLGVGQTIKFDMRFKSFLFLLFFVSLFFIRFKVLGQSVLRPCHTGDLWGYCDLNETIVIKQEYQKAYPFIGSIAPVVRDDGYWWFINQKGHVMFNTRRWSDQTPLESVNGLFKVQYFDPVFANVTEYYNKAGLPVKVDSVFIKNDTIPYRIFNFGEALKLANSKTGTPYGLDGMDCSGFVRFIFKPFGIEMPYYASEIGAKGREISEKEIQPGDLVFFSGQYKNNQDVNHVGFVVSKIGSDFEFIHASSSQGVVVSKISNPYFKGRFLFARRVFG